MSYKVKSKEKRDGLLKDIRVLDLADEKAGYCSKLLADMGASVIKIEKPGGDPSRVSGPSRKGSQRPEASLSFYYNNTNKKGITLDIEQDAGREIFLRILGRTDVVVETFPPGYLEKLGLGFKTLSKINLGLILASVTGFGQYGPRRDNKACDIVASAMGGQMYVCGTKPNPPLKVAGEQSYFTASLFAALGILLSLRKRRQNGRGEHIDVSLQESVAATLEHVMVRYFDEGVIPERQGGLHWNNAFSIFPCKDGFIHLTLFHQWKTLVEWMDSEGMAEDLTDGKWDDQEYRLTHIDHVLDVLGKWTMTHNRGELFEVGQLMHFPWAPVFSPMDVVDSPQLKARGFFVDIDHPEIGDSLRYPGLPYKFSSQFLSAVKRAPLPGEDNERFYKRELGLSDREFEKLLAIEAI